MIDSSFAKSRAELEHLILRSLISIEPPFRHPSPSLKELLLPAFDSYDWRPGLIARERDLRITGAEYRETLKTGVYLVSRPPSVHSGQV